MFGDFPGGPVVRNLPSNAGDVGSIPGWGTKSPQATGNEAIHSCCNPRTARETQCSQKRKKSRSASPTGARKGEGKPLLHLRDTSPPVSRTFFLLTVQAQTGGLYPSRNRGPSSRPAIDAPEVLLTFIIPSAETGLLGLQTHFPHGQNTGRLLKSMDMCS